MRKRTVALTEDSLRPEEGFFRRFMKHPWGWPVIVFSGLAAIATLIIVGLIMRGDSNLTLTHSDRHVVIVSHDGIKKVIPTDEKNVEGVIKRLKIPVAKGDRVEPDLSEQITQDKFLINVYRAAPVHVDDGKQKAVAISAAGTPRGLVEKSGIELHPEDSVRVVPTDNFVLEGSVGLRAEIDRAKVVRVALYGGDPVVMRTKAKTVGDFIKEKKINITSDDTVKPAMSSSVEDNMAVSVIRNGIHTISSVEEVPPPEEFVTDTSMSIGATAVRQPGTPGKRTNTYEITVEGGEEVKRTLLQSVVTVEPVPKIIARGTAVYVAPDKVSVMAAAGISPADYGAVDYIVGRESGWCPTKLQGQRHCPAHAPGYYPAGVGYGLVQSTPGGKMSSAGADWESNPVTQLRWATKYANDRYGGWQGAYDFWLRRHWW